jgi:hypothetical protein
MAPTGYYSQNLLRWLFGLADRRTLLAAGDPLPCSGPFTLYKAMLRRTRIHRVCWTDSLLSASSFATRGNEETAAVYRVTIGGEHVLAYINREKEGEYLVLLPSDVTPARVKIVRSAVPSSEVGFSHEDTCQKCGGAGSVLRPVDHVR